MGDLISRQAVLEEILLIEKELLRDKENARNSDDEQMLFAIDNQMNALWRARCKINNQPTAYDVGKAVERLELENKRLKTLKNNCIALSDSEVIGIENKAYDYAIKIVRNGGKDE